MFWNKKSEPSPLGVPLSKVCKTPKRMCLVEAYAAPKTVVMKQADLGLNLTTKRTRKRVFLDEMERVVPWGALVDLITPYAPEGRRGRPPFAVETMLRIHFMQQWFTLSDPAMEEALHDMALFRDFAGLNWDTRLPDETTILRFRRLLEEHKLAPQMLAVVNELLSAKGLLLRYGTVVDATLIAAPSSTKNAAGERDPQMKQSKKGNPWFFGMKAHIGLDAKSGLVHTVRGTTGSVNDVVEANALLHGEETEAWGDAGFQGAAKRPDARCQMPRTVCAGTSPCVRASAGSWTRPNRSNNSSTSWNASKPASGRRSSVRFG